MCLDKWWQYRAKVFESVLNKLVDRFIHLNINDNDIVHKMAKDDSIPISEAFRELSIAVGGSIVLKNS